MEIENGTANGNVNGKWNENVKWNGNGERCGNERITVFESFLFYCQQLSGK